MAVGQTGAAVRLPVADTCLCNQRWRRHCHGAISWSPGLFYWTVARDQPAHLPPHVTRRRAQCATTVTLRSAPCRMCSTRYFVLFHVPGARIVAGRARDFPAELSKMVFRCSGHVLLVDSATLALLVVLRFGPVHCVQLVTLRCFVGVCDLVFRASWSRRASYVFVYQQIVFPLVSIFSFP